VRGVRLDLPVRALDQLIDLPGEGADHRTPPGCGRVPPACSRTRFPTASRQSSDRDNRQIRTEAWAEKMATHGENRWPSLGTFDGRRSSTTRSIAACTAGGAVVSSSRNSRPVPASESRVAHAGGESRTEPSVTTGRPAKSLGSRIEPITVSTGHPSASSSASTAEVLPVPGLPHNNTGTPADTATP
jgi:hypothetical protein